MAHWKLTLSYDGTGFHGWQVQPGLATIQGTLAAALAHLTGEGILPQGSGRTDAGVHALAQVASFTLATDIPAENLRRALNRALPASVRVLGAEAAPPDFHARHNAVGKTYVYRIFERRPGTGDFCSDRICSPFVAPYAWDCKWPLNLERMSEAAACVVGEHDFASFAASDPDREARVREGLPREGRLRADEPEKTMVRTIFSSAWAREHQLLVYRVHGSGFLHHMVRNLVGTMVDVGRGSLAPADMIRILAARDRRVAGPTAPAQGLFLLSVDYPESGATGAAT